MKAHGRSLKAKSLPSKATWQTSIPSRFTIVTCYFPEGKLHKPVPKLRPCLVTTVLQNAESGQYACEVAFGTKHLKLERRHLDLIIQHAAHLNQFNLGMATRFDLDNLATLPWNDEFFGCWRGFSSPVLSSLTEDYVKEYAYIMMQRKSA